MADNFQFLRLAKFRYQSTTFLFDFLGKFEINLTIPIVLLATATQDDTATAIFVSRKDVGCICIPMWGLEVSTLYEVAFLDLRLEELGPILS
jgi:hypothetical protein